VEGAAEPPRAQDHWSRLMALTGTTDSFLRFYQEKTFCFPFKLSIFILTAKNFLLFEI
jgi:hypothetical protein